MNRMVSTGVVTVIAMLAAPPIAQAGKGAAAGQTVIVSEAVTTGVHGPRDEYVELRNVFDQTVNLSGYTLRFTPPLGPTKTFAHLPAGATVAPAGVFLYSGLDYQGPTCVGQVGTFDIPDSGTISLHGRRGELVASIIVPQDPPPPLTPCE